ncbi:MAG: hypothetical protein IJI22_04335 [Bacilli bacterium]|nr:hypothetical protein [Bacilli bacterium]
MTNFNIVKKPDKKDKVEVEIDEDDEIEEVEVNVKEHSDNDDVKKKMIRFMLIVVCAIIVILLILYLVSLTSKKTYEYKDLEQVLTDAAKSYFVDYPENLPASDGDIVEIDSSNLVAAGKMQDLSTYKTKDGAACSGTVQVTKAGSEYLYTPYLNCGDNYSTVELYKKIISDENIVTDGYGLYSSNGSYVFRGEIVNNYLMLDNGMWRIVKVTPDNNVVLISDMGSLYAKSWDNRYNQDRLYDAGINQYSASRVKEFLDKIYTNPNEADGENLLSDKDKTKLIAYNLCVGKRAENSESRDNSLECATTFDSQKMGLLTLSDYLMASVDPNCKSAMTKSCKNYNYLSSKFEWWLLTANSEDSSTVFRVGSNGIVALENASASCIVRPVIYLNNSVLYKSGSGTEEDPYLIR